MNIPKSRYVKKMFKEINKLLEKKKDPQSYYPILQTFCGYFPR